MIHVFQHNVYMHQSHNHSGGQSCLWYGSHYPPLVTFVDSSVVVWEVKQIEVVEVVIVMMLILIMIFDVFILGHDSQFPDVNPGS